MEVVWEIDEVHDNQGNVTDQQTLKFSWYIDNNGDIYLKYASGATFVLDAGASQYGFRLGVEKGNNYKTFYGYMIGTGKVKGDIIYFDLSEVSTTGYAKKLTRSCISCNFIRQWSNHEANGWHGEAIE